MNPASNARIALVCAGLAAAVAVLFALSIFVGRGGEWLPWWLEAIVFSASLPLGIAWLWWMRQRGSRNAAEGVPYSADTLTYAIVLSAIYPFWWQLAVLVGYGVVIGLAVWVAFSLSGRIAKVLGQTGINVMTRLMGLILAALAVEVMSDGLVKLFPVLVSSVR